MEMDCNSIILGYRFQVFPLCLGKLLKTDYGLSLLEKKNRYSVQWFVV